MKIPQDVAAAVHERAGYQCEACGGYLFADASALHHRKAKGMGGTSFDLNTVANLMQVHGDTRGGINCHNVTEYSIHQNPTRSKRLHHIVPPWENPEDSTPVVCHELFKLRA